MGFNSNTTVPMFIVIKKRVKQSNFWQRNTTKSTLSVAYDIFKSLKQMESVTIFSRRSTAAETTEGRAEDNRGFAEVATTTAP